MADRPAGAGASATEPGSRGRLTIREKAVERVAFAAALEVDGVLRHSHGIGRLAGRELPSAEIEVSGDHVRASLAVAVTWGSPLAATATRVQHQVSRGLGELSGLTVDCVDVHVQYVVAPGRDAGRRGTRRALS